MPHFAVRYRFIDRDSGHTGEGNALIKLDGNQDFDPDDPEQRHTLEGHIAEAIAQEFPKHTSERLVVLITACTVEKETP